MYRVDFQRVRKYLYKLPPYIELKLFKWADQVEREGLEEVRRIPGYHDEPLRGLREGQRSIRLNRSYRAIYIEYKESDIQIVSVEEVSKHEY